MKNTAIIAFFRCFAIFLSIFLPNIASSEARHGIAMYGNPGLEPGFVSLPYANPAAPKGGKFVIGEVGSYDSLNPHILKGRVPWQLRFLAFESLMGRSYDEPFSLYGLLAESIETGPNRDWVEFVLRPEARFSDGTPVTVEDVIWSFETLGTQGHPRYQTSYKKIAAIESTAPRTVRFTFNTSDRELALIVGMRPILQKAQWDGLDFATSGVEVVPISSAPYVISDFETGRYVSLRRNPEYWGKNVPFMRGQANFDEIRMEFFSDETALFEAFKAGQLTAYRETNPAKWDSQYDFPALRDGRIVKSEIPHVRPSGIWGYAMNTRRPPFDDWRVRDAMILAFNYEFINQTLNNGRGQRITSYFSNSILAADQMPAQGRVRALLMEHEDELLPGALDGYRPPQGDGSLRNRKNIREAMSRLSEAGYTVKNGVMTGENGPLRFEILLRQGSGEIQSTVDIYAQALKRLGIDVTISTVESAQYRERTNAFDFDMTYYSRGLSLSPGNEQRLYWGSEAAETFGSRNWMGINSPAIDAMIDIMLSTDDSADFDAAVKALDRLLTTGRYVIPTWFNPVSRIAHQSNVRFPEEMPIYGDWIGFMPQVWWETQ